MKAIRTNLLPLFLLALACYACDPAKKTVGTPGKDDGIIEVRGRRVQILKPRELDRLAHGAETPPQASRHAR